MSSSLPVVPQSAPAHYDPRANGTVFLAQAPSSGWPEVFAVLTACNPPDPDGASDVERTALLQKQLFREGYEVFPVTGASKDLHHQEPGFGIATGDVVRVAALAREFGQWGFFWVQHDELFICTDASRRGWRIGRWSERLVGKDAALPS